jgi:signal recognition particle subunit SRP54
MFGQLTEQIQSAWKHLRGRSRLTDQNIQNALKDVRNALIEADVALPVVKTIISQIKSKALGHNILKNLNPEQMLIKIVNDELIDVLGTESAELSLNTQPPAIILLAGLQGSGKTTSAAKLARLLSLQNKKVMLTSVDIYRPAAIEQLKQLAEQVNVPFFQSNEKKPVLMAKEAAQFAKKQFQDILIVDTAGRLHIDNDMMAEIKELQIQLTPTETLFVVDSMTGQDAAHTAKTFHETLDLTGVILTKTDGDARGGAALSVRQITGKPIKFMGTGEKINAFEAFHPERVASRILGMGDLLSLIEEVEKQTDKTTNDKLVKKISKGQGFDLEDFKQQLLQMNQMGGLASMASKLPGMNINSNQMMNQVNDKMLNKTVAIINSMTLSERHAPKIINGSRKKRIALGSGTQIQDINRLLKQHEQMQKMLKKISKPGGLKNMMRGMGELPGFQQIKNLGKKNDSIS